MRSLSKLFARILQQEYDAHGRTHRQDGKHGKWRTHGLSCIPRPGPSTDLEGKGGGIMGAAGRIDTGVKIEIF